MELISWPAVVSSALGGPPLAGEIWPILAIATALVAFLSVSSLQGVIYGDHGKCMSEELLQQPPLLDLTCHGEPTKFESQLSINIQLQKLFCHMQS